MTNMYRVGPNEELELVGMNETRGDDGGGGMFAEVTYTYLTGTCVNMSIYPLLRRGGVWGAC